MIDDRADTRQVLLDGAVALIRERGLDGFSVRELSARVGVSSGAPYRHFENNEALLTAVAAEVQARFLDLVDVEQRASGDAPLDRAKAYGVALVRFAARYPDHFRLMQSRTFVGRPEGPCADRARDVFRDLRLQVDLAREQGVLCDADPNLVLLTMHAVASGMASLAANGSLAAMGIDADRIEPTTRAVMHLVDAGLVPEPPELS